MTSSLPDIETASASQLIQALATRQIGALELCDATIARIEDRDRHINAVVVRDFERAREQARAADAALGRGERRPLLGLPMTVKESFNVAGLPTTWGFEFARSLPVTEDAVAVARLKTAGAVILGKTNLALALGDYESNNPVYGRTLHPLDATRTPGGSSGGSAAALASGMVSLELGSDIGGSIRVPAHFCGVHGHKPSHGLLPTRGHQFPGYEAASDVLSVIGPLARSAADLELALDVLAGPDTGEAMAYRLELPRARWPDARGLRVLALTEHPSARTGTDARRAVEDVAARLAKGGARIAHASALLPDLSALQDDYAKLLVTIVTRGAPHPPASISAHEWLRLLDRRLQLRKRWHLLFESFDVVIAPPFGTAAFEHIDAPDWEHTTLTIDGEPSLYREQLAWSGVATVAGLPSTVAPAGKTAQGLPLGVQIIGPALEDRTTIAVARWLEENAG
ncbi:amidase family protein [Variovorax sp. PAMC26660]|uniref:amidase family protein n=1 Tax=Variovorax sp. PAMC26660 TaxID=2762322 RepID=UPI00164E0B5D|nr:amidase family protein [Variovorax sp. PAMC26660]QNK65632.1 amidase [Variovorax sp. PAMC26660]